MLLRQSIFPFLIKPEGMSTDELSRRAKAIGYAAVEFWFRDAGTHEILAAAKKHGLAVSSMCGHQSLPDGLNKRANHDRIEAEVAANIDFAVAHAIPGMICFSGNVNPGQSNEDAIDACVAGLKRLAPYAEKKGVNLNMELLNSKADHPGYQNDHTAWGRSVIEKVGSPRVKLLYDIYHMQIMEGDIIRTLRDNIRWIGHVHTAGVPGRHEMDHTQELHYPAIARALSDLGYAGYVAHEFMPAGDRIKALEQTFGTFAV